MKIEQLRVLNNRCYCKLFSLLIVFSNFSNFYAQKYGFERIDTVIVTESGSVLKNPWAGGLNAAQFSTIDLNNDGLEDLFIFDRTGDKILTFINDGVEYKHKPEYENKFPRLQSWAILRDYNCDGKKDVFSYVSGGIGVWENTSTGGNVSFVNVLSNSIAPYVVSNQYGNLVNIYVSRSDIPDINDIDGDGDLDVLTFGVIGSRVEYHKNLSIENGLGCDSLFYELKNGCWGHFLETGFGTNTLILNDTCPQSIANPELTNGSGALIEIKAQSSGVLKHSGSTLLSLDLNNDSVRDLILGDVSFNNIVAAINDNAGVNMNTSFVSQDTLFPSNTTSVNLQKFPGIFYEDMDNDSIKDLIVSPNTDNGSENANSVWFYKNLGTNSLPVFNHVQNNFIQDEMIEVGSSAFPVLFDYNNDGLQDLFISNFGFFDLSVSGNYRSQIALYQNTGTSAFPVFELVTNDFQNLSTLGLGKGIYPAFSDLDNDGDIDMICGTYDGFIHYFMNTSGNLNSMNLVLISPQMQDDNGVSIDVGSGAKPCLFDLDNDSDYDLVLGEENGNLNYYENVGSQSNFIFRLRTETFGNIDVSEWWTTIGNSIPFLYKNTIGATQLFVGAEKGSVFHYNNIDNNLLGAFNQVDTSIANINIGPNAAPALGDLNGDNYIDLIVGNERGGVSLFMGNPNFISSVPEIESLSPKFKVYPNPTNDWLIIENPFQMEVGYSIFDAIGKLKKSGTVDKIIDVSDFPNGMYILLIQNEAEVRTARFVKN